MNKEIKFPEWKGYTSITLEAIEISKLFWFSDKDLMAKGLLEAHLREEYFKQMILFIQDRLEKHVINNEPLGLCLDNSKEIFEGIMITPCEKKDSNIQLDCINE